jgi:hypothetical protein
MLLRRLMLTRRPRLEAVQGHTDGADAPKVAAALFYAYDNIPVANDDAAT